MLTDRQRQEFERTGLLRLPGVVPTTDVTVMRDRFWEFLTRRDGIVPDRPGTWTVRVPHQLQQLRRAGAFARMGAPAVRAALDDLLGAGGWREPRAWGKPLATFPGSITGGEPAAGWTVPSDGWHVDSFGPEHELPGVTVFLFLLPVAERGGGTVVVPGSHRLFNARIPTGRWRSGEVKAALAGESAWWHDLWRGDTSDQDRTRRCLDGDRDGHRVRELTGLPGDVVLMHPRTLHSPAPNGLATPRMMVVELIDRRGTAAS